MKGKFFQRKGLNQLAHLAIMANLGDTSDSRLLDDRLSAP